ncbi:MAG: YjdF family protein [Clostridia bacterium]|nr:YjdF family protein [Clostridia bacterium]
MQPSDELRLTVFFEDPFWVGVFERYDSGALSVCKVTFGAEPTDGELYAFLLKNFDRLRFSKPVRAAPKPTAASPKRRQREANKLLHGSGVGTKSQQALQKQYEENKLERKRQSKAQRDAEKERQFELRQQKKKEKHRGR